jgi:metal-responsive CopG/Arc/MetJ family transcriptional regulator
MQKMTVYLPTELRAAVKRAARERRVTESEVIREAIRQSLGSNPPHPRGALFASGSPIVRAEDELLGFGER